MMWITLAIASAQTPTPCEAAERMLGDLALAQTVADSLSGHWPGWSPSVGIVHVQTVEGHRLVLGEGRDCPGLEMAVTSSGTRKPAARTVARIAWKGTPVLDLVEGTDGWGKADWTAAIVHEIVHLHQFRHGGVDYKTARKKAPPGAAWAWTYVPSAERDVSRIVVLANEVLSQGFNAQTGGDLMAARRRHFQQLTDFDPKLPKAVMAEEQLEGIATWIELKIPVEEATRALLERAGAEVSTMDASAWHADAIELGPDYSRTTGYLMARVLDSAGIDWKSRLKERGFDKLLEEAVVQAASG